MLRSFFGKRKWVSSFCLASFSCGAISSVSSGTVAADNEFLKSNLFKVLVSTVFKYRADHFLINNNQSIEDMVMRKPEAELNFYSLFTDYFFADTFKGVCKKRKSNECFENIFFDKDADDLEKTKILSLDSQYCWEGNESLEKKVEELKKQGLDTLMYWYAIADFKEMCARVRKMILEKISSPDFLRNKKELQDLSEKIEKICGENAKKDKEEWCVKEREKNRKIIENAANLKLALGNILKGDINSKILDFLRKRTYKDMFLNSKGEYHQEKFFAYMRYIDEFCERIRKGEFDKILNKDERKDLFFCKSLAQTFLKIISISHDKMPKNKQNSRFKSESPLSLESLSYSLKETLIIDTLKYSKILIDKKFLTKDYVAKAIEEITKSFSEEDSIRFFFRFFYHLKDMLKGYVAGSEDTFSLLFNILFKNLFSRKPEELIFEIINNLNCSPEKKDAYLSTFLSCAIGALGKEQRKNLFKCILSEPSVFKNGDDSKKEWVFSILNFLVFDFSEEEKRNLFFQIVENADELLRKNDKGEYIDADNVLEVLKILFGKEALRVVVDSFFSLSDEIGQKFFWSSQCGSLAYVGASSDIIIKFFKNKLSVFKGDLKSDISDYIIDLIQDSSNIRFEKQ